MTSLAGAACPVCGGACTRFPDVQHRADYPFLPGGIEMAANKTADQRLFDADGVLVAGPGAPIPDGADLFDEAGKQVATAGGGAEASTKRAPKRETR